ncbi:hypothetical protein AUEXF2481DRAFT_243500 [Aureobasidium subglaciale EXF-2481]|uniref:Uncharacterized protein n=1 Tax=Aureobasidium subglaciale (strain EXF-2481) TaxID=1043005 RepID=A0A074Z6Q5_AURSE|nr:uncharacterized protein AUEXF2481DRAFT_243500 [Aureobasidium subglaciale EXF-2481]KEQ94596.1 hypothetical protein AUEXF2481DRAFT_243500 [Aureobasidium subglaciale EXF-2481]
MPPRPHDPFNDAPRRPTSRATSHLLHPTHASGGHALRANSAARNLFAPTLSRRPTTTNPPPMHLNELVLEDSDDAEDRLSRRAAAAGRATRTRRPRAATETTIEPDDGNEPDPTRDMVLRDERGHYLHEVPALGEQINGADEEDLEDQRRLTALVQEYWASGTAAGGRHSKRWDDNEIMSRLRDSVGKTLMEEQWKYEPSDYMKALLVENHGRV